MFHKIVCFLLFFTRGNVVWASQVLEVNLTQGILRGYYDKTINGKTILAFEGIPYAEPPVGDLRFQGPKSSKPWNGTWQANNLYTCLQYFQFTKPNEDPIRGDEDCLYLNIYTPEKKTKLLDVIVHLHGGAFMFNSGSSFGHKIIMEREVVFVSINYRLGPLGFLSTEDKILPGNNGLKDQLLALKWLKENIEYFGGNPDSITLTGMSAGSSSVHIHYLSPLSEGLFNRGIALSGSALNPWVLVENSREKAKKLATLLGCPDEDSFELVKCLKERPGRQIVASVKNFLHWLYNPFSPFGIVVDKWSENPILPKHPYLLLKEGQVKDLPIIFSEDESEGLYPAAEFISDNIYMNELESKWNKLMPHIFDYNNTVSDIRTKDKISEDIQKFYLKGKHLSRETFPDLVKALSDRLFIEGIEKAVRFHAKAINSPVYYYYFKYRGVHSLSELTAKSNENYGACHGDDLLYVLNYKNIDVQSTEEDREMVEVMLDIWTSFAKTGIPSIKDVGWKRVSRNYEDPFNILFINSPKDIEMKVVDSLGNAEFWKSLPIEENEVLFMKQEKTEL